MADPLRVLTLGGLSPLDGAVGPLPLLLLPLAAWCGVRSRGIGRLLLAGVGVGILGWALGPPTARYLLPVLFPLAALSGAGLSSLLALAHGRARIALVVGAACACIGSMLLAGDREMLVRIGTTLGCEPTDAALTRWASYWPAVPAVNALAPSSRVLMVAESRTLYVQRDVLFEDPFQTPLLGEIAERAGSADAVAAELHARGVTHVLVNHVEARRIAALNGRAEYFEGTTEAGRARIEEFLRDRTDRVFDQGGVELFAVK